MEIIINEKKTIVKFSYSFLKTLAEKWKCNSINEVFAEIQKIGTEGVSEFELVRVLTDIINTGSEDEFSEEEIFNEIMTGPEIVEKVMKGFLESIPQVKKAEVSKKKVTKK